MTYFRKLVIALGFITAGGFLSAGTSISIDSQADWERAISVKDGLEIRDGQLVPVEDSASFLSSMQVHASKQRLRSLTIKQSAIWENWEQIDDITPPGLGNAYVFLPVKPGEYYLFATNEQSLSLPEGLTKRESIPLKKKWFSQLTKAEKGYHVWKSFDLKEWIHGGQVTESRWMTSAEYADGRFYLYYDKPNDGKPSLVIDENIMDGLVGEEYGVVFDDPTPGSDAGVFRDDDGTFHLIYEDWSTIDARANAFDSPLAGRVSSPDGISGFVFGEHPLAVDHRTNPTGKIIKNRKIEYELHEPEQNAYGDWTLIKVGEDYHLFGDYEPADHSIPMHMGRFTTKDLNVEFQWSGPIPDADGEEFHPDPSVGFAEGKFYIVMQKETDFVSPGPWVDGVELRAGVDTDGDGTIDEWTDWERVQETYSQKPGFARIVDVVPAQLDCSALPAGLGFQFEVRLHALEEENQLLKKRIQPIIDRVVLDFK